MEVSLNPLDFWCPSVIDLILQHLTMNQLLLLVEVSKDFESFVSNYKRFVNNAAIKVDFHRNISEPDFIKSLQGIKKNYENLHVDGSEVIPKLQLIIKHHKASWRRVKITNMIFNRPTLLQNFIDSVRTVEELTISSVFIFNCDKKILMSLPELKKLEMIECNDQENTFIKRVSFVISDCKNLTSLKLQYAGVSEENQKKLLKENVNLKVLSLADLSESFFSTFRTGTDLKLNTLSMKFSTEDRYRPKPNFSFFLSLQSPFLMNVELSGWLSIEILETLFKMTKLKTLKISQAKSSFECLHWNKIEQRLPLCLSLESLMLTDCLTQHQNVWQVLLKNAPNLNHFQMFNSSCFP